jgi:hypothetical protein
MIELDPGARLLISTAPSPRGRLGPPAPVEQALGSTDSGMSLPSPARARFTKAIGTDPGDIRIFDNRASHRAAASIDAQAFTVGTRIFFGQGHYDPSSDSGRELLAHEVAHTYQQRGAPGGSTASLTVSSDHDPQERAAHRVAKMIGRSGPDHAASDGEARDDEVAARELTGGGDHTGVARIQRAISFTTADGTFTTHDMTADETDAGFRFQAADPVFEWQPDVTIHGNPGDPFADWEVAHHQVAKGFWRNIYWGTGANRTHRRYRIAGGLPMRDATAAGNTWYSDWRAQGFAADSEMNSPVMHDNPGSAREPWDNPVAGRVGNRGWFNYGFGFVSTLSARHVPDGTGAAAFRHLNHVHWNYGLDGTFDGGQPLGARVTIASGGPINHSRVFGGFDPALRPMYGGDIVNEHFAHTDT